MNVNDERGFSLIEMLMVVAVMATVGAMAAMVSPSFLRHQKAEAGVQQALEVIRTARETAISKRRNVRLDFSGTNTASKVRVVVSITLPSAANSFLRISQAPTASTTNPVVT